MAELVRAVVDEPIPLQVKAFDGSRLGSDDTGITLDIRTPEALQYVITAPGDLGLARAYLTDGLVLEGVHPGDPYELFRALRSVRTHRPPPAEIARLVAAISRELRPRVPPSAAPAAAGGTAALAPRGPAARRPGRSRRARGRGDQPPLRRQQRLLREGARPVDDLHLRGLRLPGRLARAGAGAQVRAGRRQARARARHAAARRRLRVGRDGAARRPRARRASPRRHAVARAGDLGAGRDRARRPVAPGRGAPPRLPRRPRRGVRRRQLDRAHRAHRGAQLPGVLPVPAQPAARRWPPAQPHHHPVPTDGSGPAPSRSPTGTSSPTASSPLPGG